MIRTLLHSTDNTPKLTVITEPKLAMFLFHTSPVSEKDLKLQHSYQEPYHRCSGGFTTSHPLLLPFTSSPAAAPRTDHVGQWTEPCPEESGLGKFLPQALGSCRSSSTAQVEQWPTGCTRQGCCHGNPREGWASPKPAPTCSQLPQMNKHFGTSGGREAPRDLTWACAFHLLGELPVIKLWGEPKTSL